MINKSVPVDVPNWINGRLIDPATNHWLEKHNPHTGDICSRFADSSPQDVRSAIEAAERKFETWSALTPVARGQVLSGVVAKMKERAAELEACIVLETGKPPNDAKGEVGAAILQGEYFAGEGMRLFGRSLTSGVFGKYSHSVRQPRGVAGLIVPANTPIANIAWKVFPALICGNTVVLKASEDAPNVAVLFAQLAKAAGLPDGVLNVIQGRGAVAGAALVEDERVGIISFTGSTAVGRWIAERAGKRLARVSLELGGKNPFVVCNDANIDLAVHWAALSAFSNAGQRCAAASRAIVFASVYDEFRDKLVKKAKALTLGIESGCDLGPVINLRQKSAILSAIDRAIFDGANVLCGGLPLEENLQQGYYIAPTVIDHIPADHWLNTTELFGPVITLQPVGSMEEALHLANDSEYGLTAAIHTRNVDRAMWFAQRVRSGVANVNLGTFGSEPHMPFGGFGASGNGTREPGAEALDVYSELKNISFLVRTEELQ